MTKIFQVADKLPWMPEVQVVEPFQPQTEPSVCVSKSQSAQPTEYVGQTGEGEKLRSCDAVKLLFHDVMASSVLRRKRDLSRLPASAIDSQRYVITFAY